MRIGRGFVENEWKVDYFRILGGLGLDKENLVDKVILSGGMNRVWKGWDKFEGGVSWWRGLGGGEG